MKPTIFPDTSFRQSSVSSNPPRYGVRIKESERAIINTSDLLHMFTSGFMVDVFMRFQQ